MNKDDTAKDMYRGNISANFMSSGATKMNIVFGEFWGRGRYKCEGGEANYWTSTPDKDNHVASWLFRMGDSRICKNRVGLAHLFSIRCVKDAGGNCKITVNFILPFIYWSGLIISTGNKLNSHDKYVKNPSKEQ